MKKLISVLLALAMVFALAACGQSAAPAAPAANDSQSAAEPAEQAAEPADEGEGVHIGIITGSVSQSEDDRRGAEAFQAMYGEDMVKLAI